MCSGDPLGRGLSSEGDWKGPASCLPSPLPLGHGGVLLSRPAPRLPHTAAMAPGLLAPRAWGGRERDSGSPTFLPPSGPGSGRGQWTAVVRAGVRRTLHAPAGAPGPTELPWHQVGVGTQHLVPASSLP